MSPIRRLFDVLNGFIAFIAISSQESPLVLLPIVPQSVLRIFKKFLGK